MTKLSPDGPPRFEGCKPIFHLVGQERFLGMINYKGEIIIVTDCRVCIYEPETNLMRAIVLGEKIDG